MSKLYDLLKLFEEYYYLQRYVSEENEPRLRDFNSFLNDALGAKLVKTAPPLKKLAPPRYMLTVKGIELLTQMKLNESSNHLEKLTVLLSVLTILLIATSLSSVLATCGGINSQSSCFVDSFGYSLLLIFGIIFILLEIVYFIYKPLSRLWQNKTRYRSLGNDK